MYGIYLVRKQITLERNSPIIELINNQIPEQLLFLLEKNHSETNMAVILYLLSMKYYGAL